MKVWIERDGDECVARKDEGDGPRIICRRRDYSEARRIADSVILAEFGLDNLKGEALARKIAAIDLGTESFGEDSGMVGDALWRQLQRESEDE